MNLNTLVENAIAIECHENYAVENLKDSQLKQTFILISAFNNEQGVIPVKFDARVTEDNSNKIYVAITAQKIEPNVVLATEDSKSKYDPKSKVTNQSGSFTANIKDILSKVNSSDVSFIKYIPDRFLNRASGVRVSPRAPYLKALQSLIFQPQGFSYFSDLKYILLKTKNIL